MIQLFKEIGMFFHYGSCHKTIADLKNQVIQLESDNALLHTCRGELQEFNCSLEGKYKQSKRAYEEKINILESRIKELESLVPVVEQSERAIESELDIVKKSARGFEMSSGNVFADICIPHPEQRLAQAHKDYKNKKNVKKKNNNE